MRQLVLTVGLLSAASAAGQTANIPLDPVEAVLDAFETHDLVGVPEGHGNEQSHAFVMSLISHPRFPEVVDDIVVEFGNARYQDEADRFVSGEEVPGAQLRQVWQNTTVAYIYWDLPIYEAFFRAVRAVNARLAPDERVRVLLGDPPIDWETVRSAADHGQWVSDMARDRHPAAVVQREVLDKGRRGVLLYGWGHLQRRKPTRQADTHSVVGYLEAGSDVRIFTIWPDHGILSPGIVAQQPAVGTWESPSLTLLRGTVAGATPWRFVAPIPASKQANDALAEVTLGEQFDAVLYLGPRAAQTTSVLAPVRCRDTEYLRMRLERMALLRGRLPPRTGSRADGLRDYCAQVAPP